MTISPEDWNKLENQCKDKYRVLINRDELRSHFKSHQQPQIIQTVAIESEIQIRDELGFKPRRKGNTHIGEECWLAVGGQRDLEDLVLECIDAGIELIDYL